MLNPEITRFLNDLDLPGGLRHGRCPKDGYARGWGLQFGELGELIRAEPLFQKALSAAELSLVQEDRLMNLYLLATRYLTKLAVRNIVEFGSYKGGSAIFLATVMKYIDPQAHVLALDTFAGMPATDKTIDAHSTGDFSDTTLADFQARIAALGLDNLTPVQGRFEDTFPACANNLRFGIAHIDCDIYSAVKFVQDAVWPLMGDGGYVVYDDATVTSCLGATEAVEDLIMTKRIHSEQIFPHFVFRAFH